MDPGQRKLSGVSAFLAASENCPRFPHLRAASESRPRLRCRRCAVHGHRRSGSRPTAWCSRQVPSVITAVESWSAEHVGPADGWLVAGSCGGLAGPRSVIPAHGVIAARRLHAVREDASRHRPSGRSWRSGEDSRVTGWGVRRVDANVRGGDRRRDGPGRCDRAHGSFPGGVPARCAREDPRGA